MRVFASLNMRRWQRMFYIFDSIQNRNIFWIWNISTFTSFRGCRYFPIAFYFPGFFELLSSCAMFVFGRGSGPKGHSNPHGPCALTSPSTLLYCFPLYSTLELVSSRPFFPDFWTAVPLRPREEALRKGSVICDYGF